MTEETKYKAKTFNQLWEMTSYAERVSKLGWNLHSWQFKLVPHTMNDSYICAVFTTSWNNPTVIV